MSGAGLPPVPAEADAPSARAKSFIRRNALVLLFALGVLVPVAAIVHPLIRPLEEDYWHRRQFDPAAWQENAVSESPSWPPRLTMVDDLVANHDLVGRSRLVVEQLLGPADDTAYHRSWDMVYWLGSERGLFRIDSEWLVMKVDEQGLVTEVGIVRD